MVVKNIDTDGGTLAVEVEGNGPLIVCSPGMGDTRDAYVPLAAQLVSKGYKVARMDSRGHGDSSAKFNRYGDEPTADDFLLAVEKLDSGPAVLAGCSFSAAAATIAAGRRPDLVKGIILLGPFLRNGASPILMWIFPFFFWRPWGPPFWNYYAKMMWQGLGDKASERAAASTKSLTRPERWAAFQALVSSIDHSVVDPWLEKAKQTPALVVMGDKDPDWSKPLEEAEWVASNFNDREILAVSGAGHAPMLERPDEVGKGVVEFLERLRSKGAI